MSPAIDRFVNGPANTQRKRGVSKARAPNKVRITQARSKGVTLKKAVNSFVMFRSMMSRIFPEWKQSERSRFIRAMWAFEQHKSVWSIIARVWTFIRDNSNYRFLDQYLISASTVCNLVHPQSWLDAHNCVLSRDMNGTIQVLQTSPPAVGSIPAPAPIGDVELLHRLIRQGLALEKPLQLLAQIIHHHHHVLNFNKPQDFISNDETMGQAGRELSGFAAQLDFNPVATFADMLQVNVNSMILANGVNVVDVEDVTSFDHSLIISSDMHTQHPYNWDTIALHQVHSNDGSINPMVLEQGTRTYDLDQPNIWGSLTGQACQIGWESGVYSLIL
ncbi:mating type protein MAT1-1-1 [Coniella lustricola]|uniref:Mating type protein MAT1-1-1 n=1 Tax=Coniella lustricola TaxID=2025994 RepID=A0A2T3ALL4_9PEZI|nr:mating type protein MAT1-1-1 [Coniella lustricola]